MLGQTMYQVHPQSTAASREDMGWQVKSLHSVSASRFSIFLLSRRALQDIKAFLDGSVDPSKHMALMQTCTPLQKKMTKCSQSTYVSSRLKNTTSPSQERARGILGFSNENSRWHSTPCPKAQHWNHSGSDTFITAHKADGRSLKGLWSLEDVWAGLGRA